MVTVFGPPGGGTPFFAANLPEFQLFRGYWEGLRQGKDLPRRNQIDPRGLNSILPHVCLIERIAAGHGRFRIAGMAFYDLMGMDVRGMPVSALFDPPSRGRLSEACEPVYQGRHILDLRLEGERSPGKPEFMARLLLLPLGNGAEETPLVLGCLVTEGTLGRAPRRFVIAGISREPLQDAAAEQQPGLFSPAPQPQPTGFAEPAAPAPRTRHLRLVHSRD